MLDEQLLELERLVGEASREDVPRLLGRVTELEARLRMRLAEGPATAPAAGPRLLDVAEAAAVAGTSERWLLKATRGLAFRRDLSRKQPRFEEGGLRRWLTDRRR